jgi:adenylate cyclase
MPLRSAASRPAESSASLKTAGTGPTTTETVTFAGPEGGAGREAHPALAALAWWRRFDVRIAALFGGTALLVVVASGLFAYSLIVDSRLRSFTQRLESLALSLTHTFDADAIPELPRQPDGGAAWRAEWHARLLRIVEREPDIDSIYVLLPTERPAQLRFLLDASKVSRVAEPGELYDASGYPFMLRGFAGVSIEDRVFGDEFGETQSAYAPLRTTRGEVVGVIGVDVLAVRLDETRRQVIVFCVIVFGVAAGAVVVLAVLVRRRVRRPLSRVLDLTAAVAAGRHEPAPAEVAEDAAGDEFSLLGRHLDDLARQLRDRERLRATFGLYVSDDLARAVLADEQLPRLGGVERLATVLFADLSHYTRVSEQFSPTEIVALANEYLGAMTAVVEKHGGCVLEFSGDGLMAVFGVPVALEEHADRALRCALLMQQRMTQLNGAWEARGLAERWQKAGVDQITLRVGIHTGPVVAGHIGGASRMKYCVMGDTVNVAARLEEMNKELGTRIAISAQVKQRASAEAAEGFVDCDLRALRGRLVGVHVFAV